MQTQNIEMITPTIAAKYLANPDENRALNKTAIKRFAEAMLKGNWTLNHQGIAFNTDGRLSDGQHRLSAVIMAEIAVHMWVARGLTRDEILNVDRGRSRTPADILSIHRSATHAAGMASALRHWRCINAGRECPDIKMTPETLLWLYDQIAGDLLDVYLAIRGEITVVRLCGSPSLIAAAFYALTRTKSSDRAHGFLACFLAGEGQPAQALRDLLFRWRLEQGKSARMSINRKMRIAAVFQAYNAHYEKRNISRLKVKREGDLPNVRGGNPWDMPIVPTNEKMP